MRLRTKLLIPISVTFFLGFSFFVVFVSVDQSRRKTTELDVYAEVLTNLAATTNSAYLWDVNYAGMNQSLSSFGKIREVVKIEIQDSVGNSIASLEAEKKPPVLFTKNADIFFGEEKLGVAILTFTDSYARAEVAAITVQLVVLGAILLGVIFLVLFLVT